MARKTLLWICAGTVAAAGLYLGWQKLHRNAPRASAATSPSAPAASTPTARVKVVPARQGTITEPMTVYGVVIPAPGSRQTVSVPFQSNVIQVMVTAGQRISAGDPLLELKPGPDAQLQLEDAQEAFRSARDSLKQVQGRFQLQLATNSQVIQAQQTAALAKAKRDSLKSRQQMSANGQIQAEVSGLVNSIAVHEGQLVAAGATLLEIVEGEHLEARLGLQPEGLEQVKPGATVRLTRTSDADDKSFQAHIRRRSQVVNPSTRLVDIFVPLPPNSIFLLGEPVAGRLTVASARGFIVPRSAVLPEGETFVLYTVHGGKAHKHTVQTGVDNGSEVQIVSPSLNGDPVVVSGNYELKERMPVVVEQGQ